MSNVIQIKHGSGRPPDGTLAPHELGHGSDGFIYIGGNLKSSEEYGATEGIKVEYANQANKANQADKAKKIIANDGSELTVGTATTPIYLQNGEFKTCSSSSISGTIEKAEMLATSRIIGVKLDLDDSSSFNGQQDIVTGVTGVLPITKGGTGATTKEEAANELGVLPLSGGTLTGALSLPQSQRLTDTPSAYGINCRNSDIIGVNSVYFEDVCNHKSYKGINFKRSDTDTTPTWDTLYALDGELRFQKGDEIKEDENTHKTILHTGNHTNGTYTLVKAGNIYGSNSITIQENVTAYAFFIFIATTEGDNGDGSVSTIIPLSYLSKDIDVKCIFGHSSDHKVFTVRVDGTSGYMTITGGTGAGSGIAADSLYVFGVKY